MVSVGAGRVDNYTIEVGSVFYLYRITNLAFYGANSITDANGTVVNAGFSFDPSTLVSPLTFN